MMWCVVTNHMLFRDAAPPVCAASSYGRTGGPTLSGGGAGGDRTMRPTARGGGRERALCLALQTAVVELLGNAERI